MSKKFEKNGIMPSSTPFATTTKLDRDEVGVSITEVKYRGMIGSLLYLPSNRPYLAYSVGLYAWFQSSPK